MLPSQERNMHETFLDSDDNGVVDDAITGKKPLLPQALGSRKKQQFCHANNIDGHEGGWR